MPMNSEAPRRARIRSGESWSRASPESTMKRRGWNVVSALIALVAIRRAQLTGTPSATSAAARVRIAVAAEERRRIRRVQLHLLDRGPGVRPEARAERVVRLDREEAPVQPVG